MVTQPRIPSASPHTSTHIERPEYEVIRHAHIRALQASAPRAESPAHLLVRFLVRSHACSRGGDVTKRENTATLVRAWLARGRAHSAARSRRGAQGVCGQGMCTPASYRAGSWAVAHGEGS